MSDSSVRENVPVSRWVIRGLYLLALLLVASPTADLLTTAWPLRLTDLQWRYGFLGLVPGYLHVPILGLVLAMGVAYWQGHATPLRVLGIASLCMAVMLVPLFALWPFDVLEARARSQGTLPGILVGGVVQEAKYLGAFLVLAFLGRGSMRTARRLRGDRSGSQLIRPGHLS